MSQTTANQVVSGRFEFLNHGVDDQLEVDWTARQESQLWRFHLHYFNYAFDLGVAYRLTANRKYFDRFRYLVRSWINSNPTIKDEAWHPYPTSLRIVNWIMAYFLFEPLLDEDPLFKLCFLGSLHYQAEHLARHLEFDLLGNHLFENLRALFCAGRFFEGSKATAWRRKAENQLKEQLEVQVQSDGCHYEQSPMYHCIVLSGILDCIAFAGSSENGLREFLREKAEVMLSFLKTILFKDGTFPLFNDSALNMAPSPTAVFAYADAVLGEARRVVSPSYLKQGNICAVHHEDSGYAVIETRNSKLVIDGGKLGPDYQLGHAHCDLLSYELWLDESKVIVDSGVYKYDEGEMRRYCRRTNAHNTVMIDEKEQSEIWKSFRVARRAYPEDVKLTWENDCFIFDGKHTGYRRLGDDIVHRRRLALTRHGFWVVFDQIDGRGEHLIESYVHFHPEVRFVLSDGVARIKREKSELIVFPFGNTAARRESGWYCPEFGLRHRNDVLVLFTKSQLPACIGYVLIPPVAGEEISVSSQKKEGGQVLLMIRFGARHYDISIDDGIKVSTGGHER